MNKQETRRYQEISHSGKLLAPRTKGQREENQQVWTLDSWSPGGGAWWKQGCWSGQFLQRWGIKQGVKKEGTLWPLSSHPLIDCCQRLPLVSRHQESLGDVVCRARAGQQMWLHGWTGTGRCKWRITSTQGIYYLELPELSKKGIGMRSCLVVPGTIAHSLILEFCFSADPPALTWVCPVMTDKEKQSAEDSVIVVNFALPLPFASSLTLAVTNVSVPPSSIKPGGCI